MRLPLVARCLTALVLCTGLGSADVTAKPRARELGIPFDGTPGPLNAITDVAALPSATRR